MTVWCGLRLGVRHICAICVICGLSQGADLQGQASAWAQASHDTSWAGQAGLRYMPSLSLSTKADGCCRLDAELSANGHGSVRARDTDSINTEWCVKPYRLWARVSLSRCEARVGLQKVNFGSATMLRPLQWFDRVDPRDPLAMTDGVYGLLTRYCFQNNANIWAWGLLGNSVPKGWEAIGSKRWTPEPGARVQIPTPRGEVAATYHHRRAELSLPFPVAIDEDRVGLDGKWDVGIGCWFEAVLARQVARSLLTVETWQRMATVGLDYTFGIGSGLGLVAEHMLAGSADEPFGRGTDAQFSALAVSYPLGLLDNLRGLTYYDWKNRAWYRFVSWQRTLDTWTFHVAGFWNPDQPAAMQGQAAGKGVQLMVVFNH